MAVRATDYAATPVCLSLNGGASHQSGSSCGGGGGSRGGIAGVAGGGTPLDAGAAAGEGPGRRRWRKLRLTGILECITGARADVPSASLYTWKRLSLFLSSN